MNENEELGILKIGSGSYKTRVSARFSRRQPYRKRDNRLITSFIPGTVLDVLVKPGQVVCIGDELMILDAMKMQNKLKSSINGRIKRVMVKKGDKVTKGMVLVEIG
jgi:biotin carboxyl carrier protein